MWEAVQTLTGMAAAVPVIITTMLLLRYRRVRRRRRFAQYGTRVRKFQLPDDGEVAYAQWLHPKELPKKIAQQQIDALRRYIREGDTVIDIGAHTGDTTLLMALAAGRSGCTLAIEPNPYVFKVLEQNARLNPSRTNIIPLNFAATEHDGIYTFHYSDGGYCNGGHLSQIQDKRHGHHVPLDVVGKQLEPYLRSHYPQRLARLSYIKLDTEGYDRQILESLEGMVREYQPVLVIEVLNRLVAEERYALFDSIGRLGYVRYKMEWETELKGEPIQREDMLKWRAFDILAIPINVQGQVA